MTSMLIQAAPFMISPSEAMPRAPGLGSFTCCSRNHVMTDDGGEQQTIPCDKDKIGAVLLAMVEKKRVSNFVVSRLDVCV